MNPEFEAAKLRHGKDFWEAQNEAVKRNIVEADKFLDYESCIRLYNSAGEHVLSVLRCHDGGFDVSSPDGTVRWADCEGKDWEWWKFLASHMGIEAIRH